MDYMIVIDFPIQGGQQLYYLVSKSYCPFFQPKVLRRSLQCVLENLEIHYQKKKENLEIYVLIFQKFSIFMREPKLFLFISFILVHLFIRELTFFYPVMHGKINLLY